MAFRVSQASSARWTVPLSSRQALNGFLLILTCEGEVFFATHTIENYLGFHQPRCSTERFVINGLQEDDTPRRPDTCARGERPGVAISDTRADLRRLDVTSWRVTCCSFVTAAGCCIPPPHIPRSSLLDPLPKPPEHIKPSLTQGSTDEVSTPTWRLGRLIDYPPTLCLQDNPYLEG
ncbi:unnamed protein product [Nezara viridula]|uniref:Uncharacterized protein n=1 Tax=Nezara viridula TaxID=85310 RepID=A0A9P0MN94_NEZVI|nr:unnamed protein product [Nezara viridula]